MDEKMINSVGIRGGEGVQQGYKEEPFRLWFRVTANEESRWGRDSNWD